MSVRLYGRAVGNGSLAGVTAGFQRALEAAGLLEGLVALDKSGGDEETDGPPGALARDGVFTGNLNMVGAMLRGARHERHWVQVTPNSTYLPQNLLGEILKLPNPSILSASAWGTRIIADTLRQMGALRQVDIFTMGHGISGFSPIAAELAAARADFDAGHFRAIHFSTTQGERKGTLELIQAWQLLEKMLPGKPELLLVLDHHAHTALRQRMADAGIDMPFSVRVLPRGDLDATAMSHVLCRMHVVVAPSRGEGWGLLPLQARACGVPVAATLTTGHSAGHLPPEHVTRIRQVEDLEPIDDGPAALAPPVFPADIAEAIAFVHTNWRSLSLSAETMAPEVIAEWSWERQLARLVEMLR